MAAVTTGVGTRSSLVAFGRLSLLTACAWLAIGAGAALAQDREAPPAPAPRRVRVVPDVAPSTGGATRYSSPDTAAAEPQRVIPLYPGEARLIDAPWPVARVSVANPEVADVDVVNPQQVQLIGIAQGVTNLILWSKDERTWRARIEVEPDLSKLQGQLQKVLPRAKIEVTQAGEVIVIRGTLARAEQATQLRQFLTTSKMKYVDLTSVAGSQQVQLKVRIAEVSRTALRSLSADYAFGDGTRNVAVNNAASGTFTPSTPLGNLERSLPIATTIFGAGTIQGNSFEYFIQALAENQFLRLLAEPTLVAYSGEEARFLVGGEVPIPISDISNGTTSISIEYREYGVRLRFRPSVMGEGGIRLVVEPEVSELTDVGSIVVNGSAIPALLTRRVSTTLELKTGESFALAGLLNNSVNARNSKIPALGDLPILGTLFRSVRYESQETELVVLVTASLVEPLSLPMNAVPYPGMTFTPPNDWELYVEGSLQGKIPHTIAPMRAARLKELGLDKLNGPGAWASYEPRATAPPQAALDAPGGSSSGTTKP